MPRIFDNIEQSLLFAGQETHEDSYLCVIKKKKADFHYYG
jgi:hypothetical protein